MNNPQDIELIVRFYEGDASEVERALFAQKYGSDPAFRAASERHREAVDAIQRLAQRAKLKKMLEEEDLRLGQVKNLMPINGDGKAFQKSLFWKPRTIVWLTTAAAFVGLLFWLLQPSPTAPELFAQYFRPERFREIKKGKKEAPLDFYDQHLKYFNTQQYDSCAILFGMLPDSIKMRRKVQIRQSIALLATGQNATAVEILQGLVAQNTSDSHEARWLLALAYLQTDNVTAAQSELEIFVKMPEVPPQEKEEALKLLKKLRRVRQR